MAYQAVNGIVDIPDAASDAGFMAEVKDTRVITPMPDELLQEIDDYRFSARLPSRAEAIRRLIQRGLQAEKASPPKKRAN